MSKTANLKDGTEIVLRKLKKKDKNHLAIFFKSLPITDRRYLRVDVANSKTINNLIKSSKLGKSIRFIALINKNIIAQGLLELEKTGWRKHACEIRLMVSQDYRRKGLSMLLARELYSLAISEKVEDIIVQMMKPQKSAIKTFQRMGFKRQTVLPGYVKDLEGTKQDLIIMRCDVNELFKELEEYLADSDWQRTR